MSILVHPDKNQGDADRAQVAFDAVKRAWNLLEQKETRKACLEVSTVLYCVVLYCTVLYCTVSGGGGGGQGADQHKHGGEEEEVAERGEASDN